MKTEFKNVIKIPTWATATEQSQLDIGSLENNPPHNSCPLDNSPSNKLGY